MQGADGPLRPNIPMRRVGLTNSRGRDNTRSSDLTRIDYHQYHNDELPNIQTREEAGRVTDMAFRDGSSRYRSLHDQSWWWRAGSAVADERQPKPSVPVTTRGSGRYQQAWYADLRV